MDSDWDLHAVVRGCCSAATTTTNTTPTTTGPLDTYYHCNQKSTINDENFINFFPDLFQPTSDNSIEHFLNNLCTPLRFLNVEKPPPSPLSVLGGLQDPPYNCHKQKQVTQFQGKQQGLGVSKYTNSHAESTTKFKKRKNQVKRVCQVPAEGSSSSPSDLWSWRKYGQKPIKGSPYPRGYYKCSTSKGCLARKQVERNRSDPGTLLITYTGEHSHPVPTQRNALSSTSKNNITTSSNEDVTNKPTPSSPISSPTTLSPATDKIDENDTDDDNTLFDMPSGDIFNGLDEFAGLVTGDGFSDHGNELTFECLTF